MKLIFVLIFLTLLGKINSDSICTTENCSSSTTEISNDETLTDLLSSTPTSSVYENGEDEISNTTLAATSEMSITENVTQNATNLPLNISSVVTTPAPVFRSRNLEAVPCVCNLLVDVCDNDCCCDSDCSGSDLKAFSNCVDVLPPFPPEPLLCHRTQWIYPENVPFKTVLSQSGVICLQRDNVPQRYWIQHPKVITTLQDFKRRESRVKSIPWSVSVSHSKPNLIFGVPYKSGDNVWILRENKTIQLFSLSTTILTSACEGMKNILYLENWKSECRQIYSETCEGTHGSINASYFYSNVQVLSTTMEPVLNQTEPWLSIQPFLCTSLPAETNNNCTAVSSIESPYLSKSTTVCKNAVVQARYIIQHNGTEGIIAVKVLIWLGSFPLQQFVIQKLDVEFEWVGSNFYPSRRSGRPGYLLSNPVLIGILSENKTSVIPMNKSRWLLILTAGPNGHCKNTRPVLFNENVLAECSVPVSLINFTRGGCANMTQSIIQLLLEHPQSVVNNMVVAAFGDSEWGTLTDWVPVIFKHTSPEGTWFHNNDILTENKTFEANSETDIGTCGSVSTNLNIHIMWSSVGSFSSPQRKVIGVQFDFGVPITIEPTETNITKYIKIATTVKFTDLTPTPRSHYAPPPKYEIRLPRDFFYPLFTTASTGNRHDTTVCSVYVFICISTLILSVQWRCKFLL